MKAFEMYFDPEWYNNEEYPEDCKKIYEFLNEHGKLNINPKRIPDYYNQFSDEKYDADWMDIDSMVGNGFWDEKTLEYREGPILNQFAEWLSEQEI